MVKDNQIIITGASGFIARNLRKYLSEKNIKLISISRNDFKQFKNEHKVISKIMMKKTFFQKLKIQMH